ncbi:MAG TPA: hypothetical protein VJY15_09235 [Candidatus Acidoferrum sp.]|nr:hypothetical protein [Candidatus Acidoferrum sp.]
MFKRATEYLVFGFGRPFGVVWATEKAYFDFRRRFPNREEQFYLELAIQSRYPEKASNEVSALVSDCHNLEDAMVKAISIDFSPSVGAAIRTNVLPNIPPCVRCGKYKALSATDDLCYGCRKYPGFAACTHCHLYWDDSPNFCQKCGGKLWRLTDGPGIPMFQRVDGILYVRNVPLETASAEESPAEGSGQSSNRTDALASQQKEEEKQFLDLAMQAESLAGRCAKVWNESLADRRAYRAIRRIGPVAARNMVLATTKAVPTDETLVDDLDTYFDAVCDFYVRCSVRDRADIRAVIGSSKRLAGNLHNYAGRCANRLKETGGSEFFLRGLAATSLDNGGTGQDFEYILDWLWKSAVIHGFDARDAFLNLAKMSERETRDLFEGFVKSHG